MLDSKEFMSLGIRAVRSDVMARLICLLGVALMGGMQAATAQTVPEPSPVRSVLDTNGIDMISGQLLLTEPGLLIGTPDSGLVHERYWLGATGGLWRHNFEVWIANPGSIKPQVSVGNRSYVFDLLSGAYVPARRDGATLTAVPNGYLFTDRNGLAITFSNSVSMYSGTRIYATELTYPTGAKVSFHYAYNSANNVYLLQSVTNNAGYQLKYEYFAGSLGPAQIAYSLKKVTAINNAVDFCNPVADTCVGLTQTWPSVSYTYANGSFGVVWTHTTTDSLGRVTEYELSVEPSGCSPQLCLTKIVRPSGATTVLQYFHDPLMEPETPPYVSSVVGGPSGSSNYTRHVILGHPPISDTIVTGTTPDGAVFEAVVDNDLGVIAYDKVDGETWRFEHDVYGRLTEVIAPELNRVRYLLDARGNITEARAKSKNNGANGADIVATATYDAVCANPKTCNKPNTIEDARGKVTNYTYHASSGAQETVTLPPNTAGVRPQTRYTYNQLYAWYKNSGGSITQAATPIWNVQVSYFPDSPDLRARV